MEALRGHFLPEFLNRVDEVIVFHPLNRENLREIVDLQLKQLRTQMQENGFELELTDAAKDLLAEEGYDPVYGARPLKRVIQQRLQNTLANELLSGEHPEGSRILVDCRGNELVFLNQPATVKAEQENNPEGPGLSGEESSENRLGASVPASRGVSRIRRCH